MNLSLSRPLLALFGGDPDVFHPVARAHSLLVRRRAGLVRNRRGIGQTSPFRMMCLFAVMYGIFGAVFLGVAPVRILGAALAVAIGCVFLLMVVVTDYLDLLVNPREQLVLGAHPHDDRSILLAKLWVVGRTLAILFALLCLPPLGVVAIRDGFLAGAAYLAGSAGAALTACVTGLYVGVAVIALFGRAAFDRVMPWLQMAFQFSYFIFIAGQRLTNMTALASIPPALTWWFPAFWFVAPLQAVLEGGFTLSIAGRSLLAAVLCGGIVLGATRWLGSRVGDRLLEPIQRRPVTPRHGSPARTASSPPRGSRMGRLASIFGKGDRRRLFDLLRVHLRADWRTRSEFFMAPIVCAFLLVSSGNRWPAWAGLGFVGWMLLAAMDVLTRSPRPELLWFVLVSPVDRARFSARSVDLMRAFQLLPLIVVFAAIKWKLLGVGIPSRMLFLALVAAYGDLLILAGRGIFPEFPFSRPGGAEAATGRRMAVMLGGGLATGLCTAGLYLIGRRGTAGMAAAIVLLVLARFPVTVWMQRRVAAAAENLELQAGSVA